VVVAFAVAFAVDIGVTVVDIVAVVDNNNMAEVIVLCIVEALVDDSAGIVEVLVVADGIDMVEVLVVVERIDTDLADIAVHLVDMEDIAVHLVDKAEDMVDEVEGKYYMVVAVE